MAKPDPFQGKTLGQLQSIAASKAHPRREEAAKALAERVLWLDFMYRTSDRHLVGGQYTKSPLAVADEVGGGSRDGVPEPMMQAYLRRHHIDIETRRARAFLEALSLPPRLYLAALIRAGRQDPRTNGPWSAGYREIAGNIGVFALRLGWPAVRPVPKGYKDGQALNNAAKRGVALVMDAARDGGLSHVLKSKPGLTEW